MYYALLAHMVVCSGVIGLVTYQVLTTCSIAIARAGVLAFPLAAVVVWVRVLTWRRIGEI